jgi:glycosyltransferase involved in cell wall biosynthesis
MRVCVIGSGTRFLSGISYYTIRLANALVPSHRVSAILMRQLLPTRFYPGRKRVGERITRLECDPAIQVFDGVDWYWLPSMLRALAFLIGQRPQYVVFQWWSGTVLHSYLLLALVARRLRSRVIIEFHEVLDTGEMRIHLARTYVRLLAPLIMHLADAYVAHSEYDQPRIERLYRLGGRPMAVIPLGPFDHYLAAPRERANPAGSLGCCNLLYFGVIRPFKGLEDLITAFDSIAENEIEHYWLTVVGETWEGWTLPTELIARSCYRNRITFVNRYVKDEEVAEFFAGADAVVLPYHRSSASGPLHVAMSYGLPVIVTRVGGLTEGVANYQGAILVPPRDPAAIRQALPRVAAMKGKRFTDCHSWEHTMEQYNALFAAVDSGPIGTRGSGREATSQRGNRSCLAGANE